ncbi:MAG TPA: NfeD family protein [Chloroflexota bacterium]|nr:NfeD family protein [Chloroflexota bacterium]
MEWWLWLVLGVLLLAVELFTPGGFYLLFFGAGALLTGALAASRLPPTSSLSVQIVVFLAVSLAGLLLFRNAVVARFRRRIRGGEVDSLSQGTATALGDIAPGAIGKVELRGANWTARNTGGVPLARGQRCTVERVDGLTLWVRVAADEYLTALPGKEPVS